MDIKITGKNFDYQSNEKKSIRKTALLSEIAKSSVAKKYNVTNDSFNQTTSKQVTSDVKVLKEELNKIKEEQGLIGKAWDGFKNLTRIGHGSNDVEKAIGAFEKGEISKEEALQSIEKYKDGQNMSVDIVADTISGILAVGAIAAAPFTGGTSLLLAAGIGAGVKVGIKGSDALFAGRDYSLKNLGYDLITGGVNGLMAPLTNGLGGAAGTGVAKAFGLNVTKSVAKEGAKQALKQAGKEVIEEGAEQAGKSLLKNILAKQGAEYVLKEGAEATAKTTIGKILAYSTDMMVDGAFSGATDNMARAFAEGRLKDIAKDGASGFVGGAIMSPLIGGGFRIAGRTGSTVLHKINNKITIKNILPDGTQTTFKQGQTGDCHFLSMFNNMLNDSKTAKLIKKSITTNADGNYSVKIGNQTVTVLKDSLTDEMLSDNTGVRIFEQAYKQVSGSLDGGFADTVAKQFGLNPIHIMGDEITDEMLEKISNNQKGLALSFGVKVDADGVINPEGSFNHYFSIKNVDMDSRTVQLVDPNDTSKVFGLSFEDIKQQGISIDGGSSKKLDLPNTKRTVADNKFYGTQSIGAETSLTTNSPEEITDLLSLNRKERKIFNRIIEKNGEYNYETEHYLYKVVKDENDSYTIYRSKKINKASIFNEKAMSKMTAEDIMWNIEQTSPNEIIEYIENLSLNNNLFSELYNNYIVGNVAEEELKAACYGVISSRTLDEVDGRTILSALQDYKKASLYKCINGILRDKHFSMTPQQRIKVEKHIKDLTQFINTCPDASKALQLYRKDHLTALDSVHIDFGGVTERKLSDVLDEIQKSIANGESFDKTELAQQIKGKEVVFPGFFSTSLTSDAAKSCNRDTRQIAWSLRPSNGIKGIFIDAFGMENWSCKELEFLIQRGAKLQINDIELVDGVWNIDANIVGTLCEQTK